MTQILIMPKLGLTMTEGTLAQWLVQPGQAFTAGQPLFVLETEKVANEIEATADGVMDAHLVSEGDTVDVGAPLARWRPATPTAIPKSKPRIKLQAVVRDVTPRTTPASPAAPRTGRILATPYARRLAKAAGLDLAHVRTNGVRIRADDVLRKLKAP